jgi:glycosyltransferase involved in cell wall biosynthesis
MSLRDPGLWLRMPTAAHIVTTAGFAGVERHVCDVAVETAARGWDVVVVGGDAELMRDALGGRIDWRPGATPLESMRSVLGSGRWDVCHAHMTVAEAVAIATRLVHRAPVVSTRHFAAARGTSLAGRLAARWISSSLAREVAVGQFVAQNLERSPDAIISGGVPLSRCLWDTSSRVALVLQRLEPEKDTLTALQAWRSSRLVDDGWQLRIVGDGSQRRELERWAADEDIRGVTFAGRSGDVARELAQAGMLLAPAPAEPFGLSVLEAMAAGVPVVACAAGGHLETVGMVPEAPLFAPGDATAAAAALRSLLHESTRVRLSMAGRRIVREQFTIKRHVDRLLVEYEAVHAATATPARRACEVLQ